MQIVWRGGGGGDRLCHHDGVRHIESEVATALLDYLQL